MTKLKLLCCSLLKPRPPILLVGIVLLTFSAYGQTDCCDIGDKPNLITMTYTGEDCSATSSSQDNGKFNCSGNPGFAPTVYIVS